MTSRSSVWSRRELMANDHNLKGLHVWRSRSTTVIYRASVLPSPCIIRHHFQTNHTITCIRCNILRMHAGFCVGLLMITEVRMTPPPPPPCLLVDSSARHWLHFLLHMHVKTGSRGTLSSSPGLVTASIWPAKSTLTCQPATQDWTSAYKWPDMM